MNTLQLIVHLPLFNISFPALALNFTAVFQQLSQFDVLPHEIMNPYIFTFFSSESNFSYQLSRAGYEGYNFIINCGSVFWFIVFYLIGLFFFELLKKAFNIKDDKKWVKNVSSFLKYNFLISLYVEGFIELLISAIV